MTEDYNKLLELSVTYFAGEAPFRPFIRYEWFGLKGQTKRIRKYAYLRGE